MNKIGVKVSKCMKEEETALHLSTFSYYWWIYLGKVFFNEEAAHDLPLEDAFKFIEAWERRNQRVIEQAVLDDSKMGLIKGMSA